MQKSIDVLLLRGDVDAGYSGEAWICQHRYREDKEVQVQEEIR